MEAEKTAGSGDPLTKLELLHFLTQRCLNVWIQGLNPDDISKQHEGVPEGQAEGAEEGDGAGGHEDSGDDQKGWTLENDEDDEIEGGVDDGQGLFYSACIQCLIFLFR